MLGYGAMGDTYETIVDADATADEAAVLARRVVEDLIRRGIIVAERTDSVLGSDDGTGYPPGPNAEDAVEPHVHDDRCRDLPHLDFRQLWTNGLGVRVGRRVFYSMTGEQALVCRHCGSCIDLDTFPPALDEALNEWTAEMGTGQFACPRCKVSDPIAVWTWDPPWAFSCLGFTFWNWPPLSTSFVRDVSALLGHRAVVVRGKL
jgi:hypothetical protein